MALISKEELEEMYWGEPGTELSTTSIAKKIGCCHATVLSYMKKYNIPTRPSPRTGSNDSYVETSKEKISKSSLKINEDTGANIYYIYKNNKKTISELAKEFDVDIELIKKIVSCSHWTTKHLK